MSITIADAEFDSVEYDDRGDVLYLSAGAPREPARTLETAEGHVVDYDEGGRMIGMVLLNVRWSRLWRRPAAGGRRKSGARRRALSHVGQAHWDIVAAVDPVIAGAAPPGVSPWKVLVTGRPAPYDDCAWRSLRSAGLSYG